jgi:type II secretory pathway component PulF
MDNEWRNKFVKLKHWVSKLFQPHAGDIVWLGSMIITIFGSMIITIFAA